MQSLRNGMAVITAALVLTALRVLLYAQKMIIVCISRIYEALFTVNYLWSLALKVLWFSWAKQVRFAFTAKE